MVDLEVVHGTSVLDAAAHAGFLILTRCGGVAECHACRVRTTSSGLSAMADDEGAIVSEGERLSCQARLVGDAEVTLLDPREVDA